MINKDPFQTKRPTLSFNRSSMITDSETEYMYL